jgi:hypothetical protein
MLEAQRITVPTTILAYRLSPWTTGFSLTYAQRDSNRNGVPCEVMGAHLVIFPMKILSEIKPEYEKFVEFSKTFPGEIYSIKRFFTHDLSPGRGEHMHFLLSFPTAEDAVIFKMRMKVDYNL